MDFEKHKIKISINNLEYSFFYSCNEGATFQELLEHFAFLIPYLNICQCYKFHLNKDNKKNRDKILTLDSKIEDFLDNLDELILKKDNINRCTHFCQNYFHWSKQKIISHFQGWVETLYKKIKELQQGTVILNQPETQQDFYDVVVHIDSIKDIKEGWKIDMTKRGKRNYETFKNKEIIKIGVIGNANKGKSFILSKISKFVLPSGMSVKTEGLSIKYPELKEYKNRRIVLLDSAGLETPVLESKKDVFVEKDKNEIFKEKCREKLITELFLQNYIIHNSDVLIVIVDCLTFSEQKLLMKFKKEVERAKRKKPLYIIHNLKTYTTIKQVKDYIENTLLKSATFSLKKMGIVNTEKKELKVKFKFYEIKNGTESDIFHLIYANENSEAGNYYNKHTLNFIENSYQSITDYTNYDVIKTIEDRFIEVSKEIIEKSDGDDKITRDSFDRRCGPNLIKLKSDKEIKLKKCLIDEVGFSNLKPNGFEPKYNVFKKDEKIIIRVETPGNCTLTAERLSIGEYYIIRLIGKKEKDLVPEKLEDNIYNFREVGKFFIDIPLRAKDYNISKNDPKFELQKGVHFIEYELENPTGPKGPKYEEPFI